MRHPSLFHLFTPVSRIKGVGPAASETLMRLLPASARASGSGLPIIRDLLFHLPVGIVDRRVTFPLRSAPADVVATFVVTVDEHQPPKNSRFSKAPYKIVCSNDTGDITLVFFNVKGDYLSKSLPAGQQRVISGRTEKFDFHLQMTHPDIIAPVSQLAEVQKPEPVYPLTAGLTSRKISKLVGEALDKMPELPEWQAGTPYASFRQALLQLHHPDSEEMLAPDHPARMRLAYDEILAHQLQLAILRRKMQKQAGVVIKGDGTLSAPLIASLPYQLTAGQKQVLAEIGADLSSGKRMVRLLQGDVGSGKTIVALVAMLSAVEQGLQCAMMAPTELIARQHYEVIRALIPHVNVMLLTGSVKGKEREKTLAAIASGEAKIVIGTHALFQEKVEFKNLSFVVIDEQHRFGVAQRMALTQKGATPHILHMTATPIPRTLTMMLYGDMECSLLKEKPQNRKPIATRLIPRSRYEEVLTRLKAALDRGEKAYWICPLVEDTQAETGDADVSAVRSRHIEFTSRFGNQVGLVHGRMKADERNEQMHKFAEGKTKLLVATTVVEVGVDVKDATIIVIEQAERFGLSQLHQLRGRVGRGDKESACVLLYSEGQGDYAAGAQPRLSILRETEDGFAIAESDLAQRGGGELLGVRQSGAMPTVFMDFAFHTPLIEQARDDAEHLLDSSAELSDERGQAAQILLQLFERDTAQ